MRATLLTAPHEISITEVDFPKVQNPGDAVVTITATCVCGSDLWNYRGIREIAQPQLTGHEFCGVVTEVGDEVTTVKVGDFVVSPFNTSCGECAHCLAGMHASCAHKEVFAMGCQTEAVRVPYADGTLVATPEPPAPELIPSLLACSDVMATGWHAAVSAGIREGATVAVVGDGAVGLCGVLAAKQLGAARIIAMSRHADRQALARDFGATDIIEERGAEGAAKVLELTDGVGADAVIEAVGTIDALQQAGACARPGATIGYVGVPVGVELVLDPFFRRNIGLRGGMAPVRAYLPHLMDLVLAGTINPGKVFDMTLPLDRVAEGYAAMDERRAIKVLLEP